MTPKPRFYDDRRRWQDEARARGEVPECGREACHEPASPAWVNAGTPLLYCRTCATLINRYNPGLCTPEEALAMAADLTPARCLEVYREVWGDTAAPNTDRGRAIVKEMRGIAYAPNLDAAIAVVAWWWEGDRETEDSDRQRVARARALLRGEPLPLTPEVQAERAAVVAYLHAIGYRGTANAIACGEHRKTP